MLKEKISIKNHTARIGEKFSQEIDDIKSERLKLKKDKKKKSTRRLTNLLVRHNLWPKIKKEMIEINLSEEDD